MNILPYPQDNRKRSGKAQNFMNEHCIKGEVIELPEFKKQVAIFLCSIPGDIKLYLTMMVDMNLIKIEGNKVIVV